MACKYPKCTEKIRARGLCANHYASACRLVRLGQTKWADLVRSGKASAPAKVPADFFKDQGQKCSHTKNFKVPHTCPFLSEAHNDTETKCTCCTQCQHGCNQEV